MSKVSGNNLIKKATQVLLGKKVERDESERVYDLPFVGVKAPQFSFTRLPGADPVLRVDMVSTGEVGCLGDTAEEALLKSMLSVGYKIPQKSVLISGGPIISKSGAAGIGQRCWCKSGYTIYATQGTHRFFAENSMPSSLALLARRPPGAQRADLPQGEENRLGHQHPQKPLERRAGQRLQNPPHRRGLRRRLADECPAGQGVYSSLLHAGDEGSEDQELERV